MMRTTGMRLQKLVLAQDELRRVADYITPDVAPQVAKRVRSLLKSVDGAIRHAERMQASEQASADRKYVTVQREMIDRMNRKWIDGKVAQ